MELDWKRCVIILSAGIMTHDDDQCTSSCENVEKDF